MSAEYAPQYILIETESFTVLLTKDRPLDMLIEHFILAFVFSYELGVLTSTFTDLCCLHPN